MQSTSDLYKELLAGQHWKETRLQLGGTWCSEAVLIHVKTYRTTFAKKAPMVGCCISGEIDLELLEPEFSIPRQASIINQVRLTDGTRHSEWLPKGKFYIDTRQVRRSPTGKNILVIHGFDDMLRTEKDYPNTSLSWPALDIDVLLEITSSLGLIVDPRTLAIIQNGYAVQYPADYSCREVLGYIAAMYGGNFIMSDEGKLLLVQLTAFEVSEEPEEPDVPDEPGIETHYLVNETGDAITFGGDRIIV